MSKNFDLSSPAIIYYQKIAALFGKDPAVRVEFDRDNLTIKLYVDQVKKASAIEALLPAEKTFGNLTVRIEVVMPNARMKDYEKLFNDAFEGNPAFKKVQVFEYPSAPFVYVVFKPEVVQYFTDNAADLRGLTSTLYQDIARDVLDDRLRVFYSTDRNPLPFDI